MFLGNLFVSYQMEVTYLPQHGCWFNFHSAKTYSCSDYAAWENIKSLVRRVDECIDWSQYFLVSVKFWSYVTHLKIEAKKGNSFDTECCDIFIHVNGSWYPFSSASYNKEQHFYQSLISPFSRFLCCFLFITDRLGFYNLSHHSYSNYQRSKSEIRELIGHIFNNDCV